MKLGASYNIFDGEELLAFSINCIREHVDYISVVYMTTSYRGQSADPKLVTLLEELSANKMIDELYNFVPNPDKYGVTEMEVQARDMGLQLSKQAGCSHFMTMDVDEFYTEDQFIAAKKFIEENDIGCSASTYVNYLRDPHYRIEQEPWGNISFINKINSSSKIVYKAKYPVLVDPTKAFSGMEKFYRFSPQELVTHHMQFVRKDLEKKFQNSSIKEDYKKTIRHVLDWKPGQKFRYSKNDPYLTVTKVDNIFGIVF